MPPPHPAKRSERLQVMLLEAELKIIDEWRFENRIPSRAAAIRELLRRGLLFSGYEPSDIEKRLEDREHTPRSDAFGVIKGQSSE